MQPWLVFLVFPYTFGSRSGRFAAAGGAISELKMRIKIRKDVFVDVLYHILVAQILVIPLATFLVWLVFKITNFGTGITIDQYIFWAIAFVAPGISALAIFLIGTPLVYQNRLDAFLLAEREQIAIRAHDEAVKKGEQRARFLATVSHEIRNPLNGIMGVTSTINTTGLNPDDAEKLRIVKSSASELLHLLNDVLDLGKIDAGQLHLEPRAHTVQSFFEEIEAFWRQLAKEKSLELRLVIDPDIPGYLHFDRHRLRQIMNNLVSNAVKFTQRGHVLIAVNYSPIGERLTVEISDSGRGIPMRMRERIFQPYGQVHDNSDEGRILGTGLGLQISRQLAVLMGGDLSLVASDNAGSRFLLTIPAPLAQASEVAETGGSDLPIDRNLRVIVGDDSAACLIVAREFLKKLGLDRVDIVSNFDEMVMRMRKVSYDVAIIDDQFGDRVGAEILEILGPEFRGVSIAYSGRSDVGRQYFVHEGFDGVLTKPIELDKVEEELRRIVEILDNNRAAAGNFMSEKMITAMMKTEVRH